MGFLWQRSSIIAFPLIIVLSASAIALARPYPIFEPLLRTERQSSCVALVVTCNHR
jgi:hypothetical protein